ncbi:MAG: hypothetical protein R3C03_16640 [Pirellulaceae bacterium]
MKILSAEMALREETRTLEQAKGQLETEKFTADAQDLAVTQIELTDRTDIVIEKIRELPDGETNFGKEIQQLTNASNAMGDAERILDSPETGAPAIAAETEAIEWLLQAKRSGNGGGGGGGSPGGGHRSGADLVGSALALLGESEEKEAIINNRAAEQATGKSGKELPEEFRSGLDRYFEVLEANNRQQ